MWGIRAAIRPERMLPIPFPSSRGQKMSRKNGDCDRKGVHE